MRRLARQRPAACPTRRPSPWRMLRARRLLLWASRRAARAAPEPRWALQPAELALVELPAVELAPPKELVPAQLRPAAPSAASRAPCRLPNREWAPRPCGTAARRW